MKSLITRTARAVIRNSLTLARRLKMFRHEMDAMSMAELEGRGETAKSHYRWMEMDDVFSRLRRRLRTINGWRFGPDRVHEVIQDAITRLTRHAPLKESVYCDLGCGRYHPIGNSAVMYLNGVAETMALDIKNCDEPRAAEALYDLLADCLARPDHWMLVTQDRAEFIARLQQFDLVALGEGRLADGLEPVPVKHIVTDIHDPKVELGRIDLMSSRAVLEHFTDLAVASKRFFEMMKPGGIAFHDVDLIDHRAYVQPEKYHYWSFLAEPDDWTDNLVNRLRPSEIRKCFEDAGFEILEFSARTQELPAGFRDRMTPRFKAMSEEDQRATGVEAIICRPKN